MPILPSTFAPPRWLANGHIQTVLPAVLPRRFPVVYVRQRLELADGDFLDLDEIRVNSDRTVVISHGLEGSSRDPYVAGLAMLLADRGWNVVAWNYRGCGGEPNRLPRSYHSGDTPDLISVVTHAENSARRVALVGFSLGGNLTLKLAGSPDLPSSVCAAVGVSAPVDLASSAQRLDRDPANRIYLGRLIRRLEAKVRAKALRFPSAIDVGQLRGVRGFSEFDDRFTAPMHGFRDAADYWSKSSARRVLSQIRVPSLLINALDDPFLAAPCYPFPEADANERFYLETPAHGGHLGFVSALRERFFWSELRIADFLGEQVPSNPD